MLSISDHAVHVKLGLNISDSHLAPLKQIDDLPEDGEVLLRLRFLNAVVAGQSASVMQTLLPRHLALSDHQTTGPTLTIGVPHRCEQLEYSL